MDKNGNHERTLRRTGGTAQAYACSSCLCPPETLESYEIKCREMQLKMFLFLAGPSAWKIGAFTGETPPQNGERVPTAGTRQLRLARIERPRDRKKKGGREEKARAWTRVFLRTQTPLNCLPVGSPCSASRKPARAGQENFHLALAETASCGGGAASGLEGSGSLGESA